MKEIYKSEQYRGYTINWYYDGDPEDPRSWDNVSKMVCWHNRYRLGDYHPFSQPNDFLEHLVLTHATHEQIKTFLLSRKGSIWLMYIEHNTEDKERFECPARVASGYIEDFDGDWWECDGTTEDKERMIDAAVDQTCLHGITWEDADMILENELVIHPISMYEHSGISVWIGSPTCPWDSGRIGFIYQTKKDTIEQCGATEDNWKEVAWERMEAEMKTYDTYLRGDVYGFEIENPDGDILDSCWGYYGDGEIEDKMGEIEVIIDDDINRKAWYDDIFNVFGLE